MSSTSGEPIVVIGAGAAGLMAAIHASAAGRRVLLLERTAEGGRKILISGGGRCNVLPSALQPGRFVSDSSANLLRRLLLAWPLEEQRSFFEQTVGIPLQLETETGKLFPASNRARDVRDGLVDLARQRGVELRSGAHVVDVTPDASRWRITLHDGESMVATSVIVATGGLSVPATGSDGMGFEIAKRTGHIVHDTYPALTPLTANPAVHAALAGISLDVTLEAPGSGRAGSASGGFLFTHRGYSGPAVLDLSHLAVRSREAGAARQQLRVRWTSLTEADWEKRLTERSPQAVLTVLREALPARLAEWLLADAAVEASRQLAQLRREDRRLLIERLVRYPLPWTGDEGYKKAEVTGGGIALDQIQPATLESRRHPGLFFCGEVLDAFGPIGGHNFAWAWATGRAAGLGTARR
ncbi:MAG: aminoacetone oxidase family FAD-binding enzyme [Gemmatimonadota bacterium]